MADLLIHLLIPAFFGKQTPRVELEQGTKILPAIFTMYQPPKKQRNKRIHG